MPFQLTVGQLKAALHDIPDEAVVGLRIPAPGIGHPELTLVCNLSVASAGQRLVSLIPSEQSPDDKAFSEAEQHLDTAIPTDVVLLATRELLDSAGWMLEVEDGVAVSVPRDPEPQIVSRAFIKAHTSDVFMGDHFEAVIALDPERIGNNLFARAGMLRLYFNLDGQFVSEDRLPPPERD